MILLTGATGKIGSALAKRLAGPTYRTRALVRSPDRALGLRRTGIDIAVGDLSLPDSLDRALEGVSALFLLAPAGPGMVELEVNAIGAASRARVELIVKLSAPGAHPRAHLGIGRWHGEIEEHLTASGSHIPSSGRRTSCRTSWSSRRRSTHTEVFRPRRAMQESIW